MKRMPRPKPDSRQPAHVIEHVVDVDGLFRQRPLVAEHLHAVDEIADAIGLRADQLRQGAIGVAEVLLEKLRGAADARQRVLDLVGQHRGEARYRARGGAMGQLALDHLRHVPLLQHEHDEAGLVRHRAAIDVDQLGALKLRRRRPRRRIRSRVEPERAHLVDQRQQRATEGHHLVELDALQQGDAARQERFRRGVGVDDAVFLSQAR